MVVNIGCVGGLAVLTLGWSERKHTTMSLVGCGAMVKVFNGAPSGVRHSAIRCCGWPGVAVPWMGEWHATVVDRDAYAAEQATSTP